MKLRGEDGLGMKVGIGKTTGKRVCKSCALAQLCAQNVMSFHPPSAALLLLLISGLTNQSSLPPVPASPEESSTNVA